MTYHVRIVSAWDSSIQHPNSGVQLHWQPASNNPYTGVYRYSEQAWTFSFPVLYRVREFLLKYYGDTRLSTSRAGRIRSWRRRAHARRVHGGRYGVVELPVGDPVVAIAGFYNELRPSFSTVHAAGSDEPFSAGVRVDLTWADGLVNLTPTLKLIVAAMGVT